MRLMGPMAAIFTPVNFPTNVVSVRMAAMGQPLVKLGLLPDMLGEKTLPLRRSQQTALVTLQ